MANLEAAGDREPRNPNHHRVILPLSTAFWGAYLQGDAEALAWGFECLAGQKQDDLKAFIKLLRRLGAGRTAAFVQDTLTTLSGKSPDEENECTSKYYRIFKRERVWLKLLQFVGRRVYLRYLLKAQAIDEAGGSVFNPKEWRGELPRVH